MRDNKKIIKILIAFIIICIIALIGIIILHFSTDLFKSDQQLFHANFEKGLREIEKYIDISNEEKYVEFLKNKKYNENTNGVITYTNSMDIEEQFIISIQGVTDGETKKSYRKINAKYGENTDVTNIEFLQENEKYGLLFSDIVKQFLCVDISDKNSVIKKLNIDEKSLSEYTDNKIKNTINLLRKNREEINKSIKEYAEKFKNNQYSSRKNKTITQNNGNIVNVNEYSLKLDSTQTKKIIKNILNMLNDEQVINEINNRNIEFPSLNINLNVHDGKIVRIALEFENNIINIDMYNNELNIQYNQNDLNIKIIKDEEKRQLYYSDSNSNEVSLELQTSLNELDGKAIAKLNIKNDNLKGLNIELNQQLEAIENAQFEKNFDNIEKVSLNELEENKVNNAISSLFKILNSNIKKTQNKNINSELLEKWIAINSSIEEKYKKLQKSIETKFNNQFLMYQGQNIEKNVTYNLIDVVGKNIRGYSVNNKNELKIYLQEGKEDKDMTAKLKEIVEKAEGNYNINFEFDTNKKISIILMELYKKE